MILKSLTLQNFRQFRGEHRIDFAVPEYNSGKRVTVIFGENGRGKTGIFRALMFGLFGERRLTQDGEAPESELSLVNIHALRDSEPDTPVEAGVELVFFHKGKEYTLLRKVVGILDRGKTIEEVIKVQLIERTYNGNTRIENDLQFIERFVNSVLDRRVREYFLFDGEKIERLTRASIQQRKEVSKGIRNLLNIDALEFAITAIDKVGKQLNSEIQSKSSGEYAQVLREINEKNERKSRIRTRGGEIDSELEEAEKELDSIDKELSKYHEISTLLQQRETLEAREKETERRLQEAREEIKMHTGQTGCLLIEPTIRKVFLNIDTRKKRGEIPPEIRYDLIEKILSEGKCICGTRIKPHSEEYTKILKWKARSEDPGVSDSALELWRHLSTLINRLEDIRKNSEMYLQRHAESNHELERIKTSLEAIGKQIGTDVRRDIRKLEDIRRRVNEKIIKLHAEKIRLTDDLRVIEKDLEELDEKRKHMEREKGIRSELIQRYNLSQEVQKALEEVSTEFGSEIRDQLSQDATEALEKLLDEESRYFLKRIAVNKDYSLQILDRWGEPFLANISAGQRQIMSIAFIVALAKAAAGGNLLEMPLFMDTPFGRLSFKHRRNLIREVPTLCAQWVLLATDTELRKQEGELLLEGGKWGKFYHLKGADDGSTIIREMTPRQALEILGSVEGGGK